jgi:raffinose/stachyose/melibiose transport system substrate-binding protein
MNNILKKSLIALLLAGVGFVVLEREGVFDRVIGNANDRIVRIGHYFLQAGVRESLYSLMEIYEAENPGVQLEAIAVPDRVWPAWVKTQIAGGTAPDILALGSGVTEDILVRYFLPFDEEIHSPNPYNAGTPLEDVSWQQSFIDGLQSHPNYYLGLMETYGVSNTMATQRLLVNSRLYKELLGDHPYPEDFESLIEVCQLIQDASTKADLRIVPIAASRDNTSLLARLFTSQTQSLRDQLDIQQQIVPHSQEIGYAYLAGEWSLDDPAIQTGLQMMYELSRHMPIGFNQLNTEDAVFAFTQERAIFLPESSLYFKSIESRSDFPIDILPLPYPDPAKPRHREFMTGPMNDGDVRSIFSFGVLVDSRNREQALDFLKFLTSHWGNTHFSENTSMIPSVLEVEPEGRMQPFMPDMEGHPAGFWVSFLNGTNLAMLVDTNFFRLLGPTGSVEAFLASIKPDYREAVADDLVKHFERNLSHLRRQDVAWASAYAQRLFHRESFDNEKMELIADTQNEMEANRAWNDAQVSKHDDLKR